MNEFESDDEMDKDEKNQVSLDRNDDVSAVIDGDEGIGNVG